MPVPAGIFALFSLPTLFLGRIPPLDRFVTPPPCRALPAISLYLFATVRPAPPARRLIFLADVSPGSPGVPSAMGGIYGGFMSEPGAASVGSYSGIT